MKSNDDEKSLIVTVDGAENCRLDHYIADNLGLFTRSQIKNRNLRVFRHKNEIKLSKKVSSGDVLEIFYTVPASPEIKPEYVPLTIVFENDDVIVLDKPQGLVVHPAPGHYSGTMVQGLMYYLRNLQDAFPEDALRPGIVHRLDKDTSGIIIAAKNPEALEFLSRQFREKTTEKRYAAFVKGVFRKTSGKIETYMGRDRNNRKKFAVYESFGKKAVTEYRVMQTYGNISFVLLTPHTGRTHQLRVHMNYTGHPILGDPLYGRRSKEYRETTLMLHAAMLKIILPGETAPRVFYSPFPSRFRNFCRNNSVLQSVLDNFLQEYSEYPD